MGAYASTLGLLNLSMICPHNALESYLKPVLGFLAWFIIYFIQMVPVVQSTVPVVQSTVPVQQGYLAISCLEKIKKQGRILEF